MSRRSMNQYQAKRPFLIRYEHWLHKKMSVVTGNSKAVVNELIEEEGIPERKLALIYNGVDAGDYEHKEIDRKRILEEFNIPEHSIVLIMAANLIGYKGHTDLFYALHGIADNLTRQWYLLCVGRDDGAGDELKKLISELGLIDKIKFLGSRMDVPDLLLSSDMAVLSSHGEGFSNFILEAMAAGLPVVATDAGGNGEAVIDGVTGRLVPAHDPRAMGKAILELITDGETMRQMGRRAKSRVREEFNIQNMVTGYEKLYAGLLEEQTTKKRKEPQGCVE